MSLKLLNALLESNMKFIEDNGNLFFDNIDNLFSRQEFPLINYYILIGMLYLSSRLSGFENFYKNSLEIIIDHINREYFLNPHDLRNNWIAPLKIFFLNYPFSSTFNLNNIDINPSKLKLDPELKTLLNAINPKSVDEIEKFKISEWKEVASQNKLTITELEYKVKGLLVKTLIHIFAHEINGIEVIENLINTSYHESTKFLKNQLRAICNFNDYYIDSFKNFCKIVSKVCYLMHLNDEHNYYLQKTATKYWEENKDKTKTNMEKDWFQPELRNFFTKEFNSRNVIKEPEITRGNVDFLVFNLPVDAKCFTDKKDKNKKDNSGLELLENEINQVYQYSSHTNLGIIVAYDFRDKESSKDIKIQSVTERIEFKKKGTKLIGKFVLIRRKTPSEIK